jgi:hypothetical protein
VTRYFFIAAFIIGAAAISFMGLLFIGSDALALSITLVIAIAYLIGFVELVQFRAVTERLNSALRAITEPLASLDQWIGKLPACLHNSVRLRIEGEKVGLPAPALSPYLVGLLVMLGLLGTFAGMVDTLKGAVVALEGSTELEAVRAGLAAPIKGLGLAFGTSVAGIAASAMLGLMSTLVRRERMLATRLLDSKITTELRDFSLQYNRQQTFKAMQVQSEALPQVADKLCKMADKLSEVTDSLSDKLLSNQNHFHESVKSLYVDLANSVDQSLQASLAESGRMAGESIKPAFETLVKEIRVETEKTQQQLTSSTAQHLSIISTRLAETSQAISNSCNDSLAQQTRNNEQLLEHLSASFTEFSEQYSKQSATTLVAIENSNSLISDQSQQQLDAQQRANETLLTQLSSAFSALQEQQAYLSAESLKAVENSHNSWAQLQQQNDEQRLNMWLAKFDKAAETLQDQQQGIHEQFINTSAEVSQLLASSETLVETRINNEAAWIAGHEQRISDLADMLNSKFEALHEQEQQRGNAAVDRLSTLESSVADHLASLGNRLEDPMTRLIETASETPRAAAEVIGHLKREISNNIERDNQLLEERAQIMKDLKTLSGSLFEASTSQAEVVEKLVNTSTRMLEDVSEQFSGHVQGGVEKIAAISDSFALSATEMSSLGEAFNLAVQLFNDSNQQLIENLNRIEGAMSQTSERSDEQLAYYVAQAREVIDHSIQSQSQLFEKLSQLSQQAENCAEAL